MSNVDSKVRELIGDMSINLIAAQEANINLAAQKVAAYEALNACISVGQVPETEVLKLLESNPDFAAWRSAKK